MLRELFYKLVEKLVKIGIEIGYKDLQKRIGKLSKPIGYVTILKGLYKGLDSNSKRKREGERREINIGLH